MADFNGSAPQVRISADEMKAFLYLPTPIDDDYIIEGLEAALQIKGVTYGIKTDVLREMIKKGLYNKETLVAEGTETKEGKDGYYEYHFNQKLDEKPKILPDGSVDYWSVNRVEIAKKGQVIAHYHPAIMGENGTTVKGRPVIVKRARELPPLKGKGFTRSENNLVYTADFDGKIEMKNDRIMIQQIYEVFGNADLSTGHIDFSGDVVIHGNVTTGIRIHAGGSITVDGVVEKADLSAGKDIILRGGIMGDSRSVVTSGGSIAAKFFEYTKVEAQGNIRAQIFLNCDVSCRGKIILSGKKAGIIGGNVYAVSGIETADLGNDVEVHTEVRVGNNVDILRKIKELQREVDDTKTMLQRVEKGLMELARLEAAQALAKDDTRKMKLLRVKIRDSALLSSLQAELQVLERRVADAQDANIRVVNRAYPGVVVIIDEAKLLIKKPEDHVEYRKEAGEVSRNFTAF